MMTLQIPCDLTTFFLIHMMYLDQFMFISINFYGF
jgi:hypothetical protein